MSLPSLMTATHPPHSPIYGQHTAYNSNTASYAANHSLPTNSSRLAPSYSFPNNTPASTSRTSASSNPRYLPHSGTMASSQSASTLQGSRKRERRPDWHEFYKNGLPEEVIVIDDDDTPPPTRPPAIRKENTKQETSRDDEHTNKKRRTGQASAYDAASDQAISYSHARTYSHGNSGSNTISTDRTTSLQTTAPTSLGSHTSHGSTGAYASTSAYADERRTGQKRKRVTRLQAADEKRRREVEVVGDAYSAYVPPPKPPIKARDVHVPTIRDVRPPSGAMSNKLLTP